MTVAGAPAALGNPDDDSGGPIAQRDTAHPGQSEQPAAAGGTPAGEDPHGLVGERAEGEEARVVALQPRSEGRRDGQPGGGCSTARSRRSPARKTTGSGPNSRT